ncbi:MAG TPA: hypothetical protein VNO23_19820 [Candidatus Binatia bacterium]|nr:hypothetical protein [Candidatus Binatia bacterium]
MSGGRAGLALALALATVALARPAGPALGASFVLTEEQRREAIVFGQSSITRDTLGTEWQVENAAGETVTVITPFHRLALAARHAAFRDEPLRPEDEQRALREVAGRLVLWVNLVGPREDFARHLVPRLLVAGREIAPTLAQNERTALPQEDGRFLARCTYWFPSQGISGQASVALVVRDSDGRAVSRFTIDLGRMR